MTITKMMMMMMMMIIELSLMMANEDVCQMYVCSLYWSTVFEAAHH